MQKLLLHASINKSIAISRLFSAADQTISGFSTLSKGLDKALKILDLVAPNTSKVGDDTCHHRLIQSCMWDLLEIGKQNCSELAKDTRSRSTDILLGDDLIRGISLDANILSLITTGDLDTGAQLHALVVKAGYGSCIMIGSSLVTFYAKCGRLDDAFHVFEKMPVRNVVAWTVLISGYARQCEVETCFRLFILMRRSMLKPNDFTFASLLSASSACLGLGRSVQCLGLRMGFDSYLHVSNALISMYAKSGIIDEARFVFERIVIKDVVSWNSMIFGYAQSGFVERAIDTMEEMDKHGVRPDALSFLGVLSSCRHAGLVGQGRRCFDAMVELGIEPGLDHCACVVDLLCRAGLIEEALGFVERMSVPPNAVIWGSVLSACRVHGNVSMGIRAAEIRLLMEPGCASTHVQLANLYAGVSTHVQLANLYAGVGCWNRVAEVRKLMKERRLKTSPGYSWIEIGNKVHRFKAEDHAKAEEVLTVLDSLFFHMKFEER